MAVLCIIGAANFTDAPRWIDALMIGAASMLSIAAISHFIKGNAVRWQAQDGVEEPRARDTAVATGLLLQHLGVEQGPATYSDKVQWGVQPKEASKWPRYVVIGFFLTAVVAALVALSWSLEEKLKTPSLTLTFGFTELVIAAALSIPAIRSYGSYRAIERDVKANLVDEIAVDGTSAWVVDEQARVPITAIKNLRCYGLHETRIRMGVQTASKTFGFDPSHLLIDPWMERDGSLDPSSPPPLPPLFPASRHSRLPDTG